MVQSWFMFKPPKLRFDFSTPKLHGFSTHPSPFMDRLPHRIRIKETKEVYEGEVTELTPEEKLWKYHSGVCGFYLQTASDQILGMQGFLAIVVCWFFAGVFLSDVYHCKASVL